MRRDMASKLVERPRFLGVKRRKGRPRPLDELPSHEPMSMGRGTKGFSENLAPLRRFLHRRVGQPWDRVYSEIRAHLAPNSTVHIHVLQHLDQMVEKRPVIIDGWPYHPPGCGFGFGGGYFPIRGTRWDCLYVCPETGKLARFVQPRRRRRRDRR